MAEETAERVPFHVRIAQNKRMTVVLVVLFSILLAFVAFWVGLIFPGGWEGGVSVAAAVGIITFAWFLSTYYSGGYLLMTMHHAIPADPDRYRVLHNVVDEMTIAAGIPRPLVFVVPTEALNAFATGRDPDNSIVAVTTGLVKKLDRDELQGVVAHEISHIRNYDIRLMMMVATFAGMVVILSEILWYMSRVLFHAGLAGSGNRRGGGGLPLLVLAAVAAIIALVAPIIAMIIQFAISRQREYLADASAVELTRYPDGLARALEKIAKGARGMKFASKAAAHLYIQNPFIRASASSIFATHPPIQERIRRIRAMM